MNGITVVSNLKLFVSPQAATIPVGLVCVKALAKTLPPTVSTTQSQIPLSNGLVSPSSSDLSRTTLAPNLFKKSVLSFFSCKSMNFITHL